MKQDEAKEILKLYRPMVDAGDPSFVKALEVCERDIELNEWFQNHCAVYAALRNKFESIAVPEGLKEQIIAERKVQALPQWRRVVVAVLAVATIIAVISFPLVSRWNHNRTARSFPAFLDRAASIALRNYGMDLTTDNLDHIREWFAQHHGIADYSLPSNLEQNAHPTGCVATMWHGRPVSMICFRSGKALPEDQSSDLWLFVIEQKTAPGTPVDAVPRITKVNRLTVASWTVGERTYVLATDGDRESLERFL